MGLLGFINPLVAQYKGAARGEKVALVIGQGSIIALLAYPLILLVGYFLVPSYFSFIGIHEEERKAALDYFFVINLGTIFLLMKTTFASYFSGIKKTRIVMISNLLGLIVNVPATYFLVFGGLGSYFSGYSELHPEPSELEELIDHYDDHLEPLKHFLILVPKVRLEYS